MSKFVIDCTGDCDLAARAGAEFEWGRDDGLIQPMTLMFEICGARDFDQTDNFELFDLMEKAIKNTLNFPARSGTNHGCCSFRKKVGQ
ncbi:MAG TPA: hypothetical protein DC049_09210 [Spirochaetia bacterium]|nr:hypothetical protein [Spirochaetia bacterium]